MFAERAFVFFQSLKNREGRTVPLESVDWNSNPNLPLMSWVSMVKTQTWGLSFPAREKEIMAFLGVVLKVE